ncbi:hypothetical protein ACT691_00260 [Vibrio metschnikovii]
MIGIFYAKHIIDKLYAQQSLSQLESQQLFDLIIRGELDPILIAAVLTALKMKGETPDEIAGAAQALLANAEPFRVQTTTLRILSAPVAMVQTPLIFPPLPLLSPPPAV